MQLGLLDQHQLYGHCEKEKEGREEGEEGGREGRKEREGREGGEEGEGREGGEGEREGGKGRLVFHILRLEKKSFNCLTKLIG